MGIWQMTQKWEASVVTFAVTPSGDKSLEELLEIWISELEYLGRTPKHTGERRHSVNEMLRWSCRWANTSCQQKADSILSD